MFFFTWHVHPQTTCWSVLILDHFLLCHVMIFHHGITASSVLVAAQLQWWWNISHNKLVWKMAKQITARGRLVLSNCLMLEYRRESSRSIQATKVWFLFAVTNHQQNQAVSNILTSGTRASGSFQDEVAVVKAVEAVNTCFWSSAHINNYALCNFSNSTSAHAQYDGFAVSCKSIAISLIINQNRNGVCQIL